MVLFCMENEKKIKQRIADLNKQAEAEQKRLAKFRDTISKLDNIRWRVDQALNDAEKL